MAQELGTPSRRAFLERAGLTTAAVTPLSACLGFGPDPVAQLRRHESELEPLRDPGTAVSEGYRSIAGYVRSDEGTAGLCIVNGSVSDLDPATPHAVLYNLTDDGGYEPLGVKWFVPAGTAEDPPTLFDTEFDGPFDAREPVLPRHYGLHAWLFEDNPDGMFAPYNRAVEPPSFLDALTPVWDRLRELPIGQDALKSGYTNTEKCVAVDDGGYGVPFVDNTDDGADRARPPILLYRITPNWNYRLLGAEWYVPVSAVDRRPSKFGQPFHRAMDGHSPKTDQPRHYGLHAWLLWLNPGGLFSSFHPAVSC